MKTLAWIALQAVVFGSVVWSEVDSARISQRAPDFVTGGIMGIVLAWIVTASIIGARDLYMRYLSPRRHTGPTLNPRSAIGHEGETSGEGERLITSAGSSRDAAEVIPGRRIS